MQDRLESLQLEPEPWRQKMPRVKRGTVRRAKRKKLLGLAKGYYANKSKLYRAAKESVDTALKYAFVGRRRKKRDFRRLWVVRINAAARENGLTYGAVDQRPEERRRHARPQEPVGARDREPGGVRQAGGAGQSAAQARAARRPRRAAPRRRSRRVTRVDAGASRLRPDVRMTVPDPPPSKPIAAFEPSSRRASARDAQAVRDRYLGRKNSVVAALDAD